MFDAAADSLEGNWLVDAESQGEETVVTMTRSDDGQPLPARLMQWLAGIMGQAGETAKGFKSFRLRSADWAALNAS